MNTTELKETKQTMYTTNMKDTYEKIQALLTEQLQTPVPMT